MWKNRVFLLGAAALALLAIVFTLCRKTVTPLPQPAPASTPAPGPLTGVTICVDPGHGGYDGGARGQASGALEKDVNLAVALCLSLLTTSAFAVDEHEKDYLDKQVQLVVDNLQKFY